MFCQPFRRRLAQFFDSRRVFELFRKINRDNFYIIRDTFVLISVAVNIRRVDVVALYFAKRVLGIYRAFR